MEAVINESPLNIEETAKRLGISPHTVRSLIRERRLAHHKVGRRVVVDPVDIDAFLKSCRIPSRNEQ